MVSRPGGQRGRTSLQIYDYVAMKTVLDSVPFFDYPQLFLEHKEKLMVVVQDVMSRGAFILQRDLEQFEENLARYVQVKHVVGVANGTDALIIALKAIGIGRGAEVIVPSHTYVASVAAIHFSGATPVLVECGLDRLIDLESVEAAITSRTKAIMPVHLNGRTAAMDALQKIADEHDLRIVEDAAQALGSQYRDRFAGTFGAAGTFSFYPAKLLGCFGDGGAVVTDHDEVAQRIRLLRDHGRDPEGVVKGWGFNSRLDNLQAAILNLKLESLDQAITRRRTLAQLYQERLGQLRQLRLPPAPDADPNHYDVYQNYEIEAEQRDELRSFLSSRGLKTAIQWEGTPVHQMRGLGLQAQLPKTDQFFRSCMLLPMNTTISDTQAHLLCDVILQYYQERRPES